MSVPLQLPHPLPKQTTNLVNDQFMPPLDEVHFLLGFIRERRARYAQLTVAYSLVFQIKALSPGFRCPPRSFAPVPRHFREGASVDVVEVAEDIHARGCAGVRADERDVVFERRLVILDADTAAIVQIGDIGALLALPGADDAIGSKRRSAAPRMVHDDDVLDPEEVRRDCDRAERVDRAAAGHDDGKDRRRRGDALPRRVADDLAGIYLIAEALGHDVGDLHGARIVAVNHQSLERYGVRE